MAGNSKNFALPGNEGAFARVGVDPRNGNAQLSRTSFEIMTGQALGLSAVAVNAIRAALVIATPTVVEEITRQVPAGGAGLAMTIRSSDVADVGAECGYSHHVANVELLPSFEVTLNGTTPVALPVPLVTRINSMSRVSGDFAGNVLIENGGATYGAIALGQQLQRSSRFTVPANYRLHVTDIISSLAKDSGANSSCIMVLQGKPALSTGYGSFLDWCLQRDGTNTVCMSQQLSPGITGPFDLHVSANATAIADVQVYIAGLLSNLLA